MTSTERRCTRTRPVRQRRTRGTPPRHHHRAARSTRSHRPTLPSRRRGGVTLADKATPNPPIRSSVCDAFRTPPRLFSSAARRAGRTWHQPTQSALRTPPRRAPFRSNALELLFTLQEFADACRAWRGNPLHNTRRRSRCCSRPTPRTPAKSDSSNGLTVYTEPTDQDGRATGYGRPGAGVTAVLSCGGSGTRSRQCPHTQ